ncbi:MAG: flagellar hook-basal body complex protein FliE [Fibrobacter sp.]|jgi:flagellar hook-basal body complex protein FliE|nr:flagellar hook-basal body complex protein FliE [Fibrobacter sp.]
MMNEINSVGPVSGGGSIQKGQGVKADKSGPSFKDTLNNFLSDVNEMQQKADQSIQKMVSGEITDVHQVMSSVEEASVAFNMMMEIRNKVMDAYQEIMRIRL